MAKVLGTMAGIFMGMIGTFAGFALLLYFVTLGEINLFLAVFGG